MEPIILMDVASLHPEPVLLTPAQVAKLASIAPKQESKPVARPRKERSVPVRNPAFRESKELIELQRRLHAEARNK